MKYKTVYILGAGCSANCGYPLAMDFVKTLTGYGEAMWKRENCQRLSQSAAETAALMEKHRTPTIDRLVRRIEWERIHTSHSTPGLSYDLEKNADAKILNAKIATAGLFLERESAARVAGISCYEDFLSIIFDGNRDLNALESPFNRVLSFNYDRLFEIAFADYFDLDPQSDCYAKELLNSGFGFFRGDSDAIAPNRFCFLKLHGTAAMWTAKRDGEQRFEIRPALHQTEMRINDELFWPTNNCVTGVPNESPEPLIVFPHEKERVLAGGASHSYANYIERIWEHANKLIEEAEQIWVIGYSFDPNDRKTVMDRLKPKSKDCKIIVQNPNAEIICTELELRYPELAGRLSAFETSF